MSMAATPDKKTVVRELMELGKQKGQLTNQDILDAIGEIGLKSFMIHLHSLALKS